VGGLTLYANSFQNKSVATVKANIQNYQNASKVPLIIAVDEEGGSVVRVSAYTQFRSTPFLSPQKLYANGGFDAIYNDTVEKAQLLKSLGINLNFAPVADVSTNSNDYIYSRTFGKNATQTAKYISTSVQAYNSQNFACTLKHFPGYGNNLNTHTGISIDTRSKESFYSSDFLPFISGIENNAPFVMVNHNIVNCFDSTVPASISAEVHRVLREDLGYTGIVLTDDLYMDAIKDYTGTTNACGGYNAVLNAVKNGTISEYRIDESVIRVLAYKYYYNLI
jgi:beta-N-acetylhexosaminidase